MSGTIVGKKIHKDSDDEEVLPAEGQAVSRPSVMKRLAYGLTLLAALIGLVAIAIFAFFVNSGVKGQIKTIEPTSQEVKDMPKYASLNAQYFKIKYLQSYSNQNTQMREKAALEQYFFVASTAYEKKMAIAIHNLPNGLKEDASYKMRKLYTDKYKEREVAIGDGRGYIMAKVEANEQVLFVPRGDKLATIALTSQGSENLAKEIDDIAASFRWSE